MVETKDFVHPWYKLPVFSLYGETRVPTEESLKGIDTFVVDLQDVGTRVYTYIATLTHVLKRCAGLGIRVVVLDRPNPVGGKLVEGPVLKEEFRSFVGPLPLPQRHSLTMGEVALFAQKDEKIDGDITVIEMQGWKRSFFWRDLKRIWINPSPNLPTPESAIVFCGSVLFEGTTLSEGRGTTRSLEVAGHPGVSDPDGFLEEIQEDFLDWGFQEECVLRPVFFHPMFGKHTDLSCGGFHIHPLDKSFRSWRLGQFLLRAFKRKLGEDFFMEQGALRV